jgi:hypothetical protein
MVRTEPMAIGRVQKEKPAGTCYTERLFQRQRNGVDMFEHALQQHYILGTIWQGDSFGDSPQYDILVRAEKKPG